MAAMGYHAAFIVASASGTDGWQSRGRCQFRITAPVPS